ncbi:MAG TPA: D-inositol-3-phosphate glycosyltransferase, partial [Pseudonocardiaceae bacterium]
SGLLVTGHEPGRWADALAEVALRPEVRRRLAVGAVEHARRFSWDRTTDELVAGYVQATDAFADALGEVAV